MQNDEKFWFFDSNRGTPSIARGRFPQGNLRTVPSLLRGNPIEGVGACAAGGVSKASDKLTMEIVREPKFIRTCVKIYL